MYLGKNQTKKIADRAEEEKENYCKRKWQINSLTVCHIGHYTLFKEFVLQKTWC